MSTHHTTASQLVPADRIGDRALELIIDLPPAIDVSVREVLTTTLFALPRWVRRVEVQYERDDSENLASCSTDSDYQSFAIKVTPAWVDLPPRRQVQVILHELAHAWHGRLYNEASSVIETLTEEGGVSRELACDRLTNALEFDTENLSYLFVELLDGGMLPPVRLPAKGRGVREARA